LWSVVEVLEHLTALTHQELKGPLQVFQLYHLQVVAVVQPEVLVEEQMVAMVGLVVEEIQVRLLEVEIHLQYLHLKEIMVGQEEVMVKAVVVESVPLVGLVVVQVVRVDQDFHQL
tara:strand:+ start:296 stop:640 length:345 start_codon:yes stop_codon:yes gene_type:complete